MLQPLAGREVALTVKGMHPDPYGTRAFAEVYKAFGEAMPTVSAKQHNAVLVERDALLTLLPPAEREIYQQLVADGTEPATALELARALERAE